MFRKSIFIISFVAVLGMGLAISRSIIEAHGGRIWAESEPGRWARFTFAIPKEPKDQAQR